MHAHDNSDSGQITTTQTFINASDYRSESEKIRANEHQVENLFMQPNSTFIGHPHDNRDSEEIVI